ncbi:uncharacterized protein STEHIDRAFT_109855 [Stereum hirsutum FP-91666 SS1]|uniref:uncharacterized protein n=1 Tax=Stereum hirsutum (strain FP-91666) TaxID=721885 RepID=UPI000440CEDB|nr:uncharacterized protein STEHIDRAFT_109855 [Stereum hirsutum FP-91666 SS1]EIM88015.1 hypothetical protein STEHIDRAFT_109855 [Stereum hirsutum FP-91666 SS1]
MSLAGLTSLSLGDIATVIGIAIQVHKALRESAGSATEHQALLADLDSLSQLLQTVQATRVLSYRELDEATTSLGRAIRHNLSDSNVLLGEVYAKITGYQTISKRDAGSMKDPWTEMEWTVLDKEVTKQIRRRLDRYTQSHNAVFSVTVLNPTSSVHGGLFGPRSSSPVDETLQHSVHPTPPPSDATDDVVSDSWQLKVQELYPPFRNPLTPQGDDIWRERFGLPTFFST